MPENITSFLYADDTALLTTGNNIETIEENLNHAICTAQEWFINKLSLNTNKTKSMLLGTKQRLQGATPIEIINGAKKVEMVDHFKYLGVVLDNCLTFDRHVSYIKKKVYVRLRALGQLRQYISRNLALQIYKSLIVPHFDYADVCYDAMTTQNAKKLQTLQNSCIRICLQRDRRSNVASLHRDSKLLTLTERRNIHSCNLVYNGLAGMSTQGINNMFHHIADTRERTTRASTSLMLEVPIGKREISKSNLKWRGATYYNQLPE